MARAGAPGVRDLAAIVLAAGSSRRMGDTNKLLLDIEGAPMVRRVVEVLAQLPFRERIVVTGHQEAAIRDALAGTPVTFVHNPEHDEGIASSLRAGVRALPDDVAAALIVLGDMPFLTVADVEVILGAFAPGRGRGIVVPVRSGRRGNPVLWAARYFAELASLTGDAGGRRLFDAHADDIAEVPVPDDGVLRDVDRAQDLRRA